MPHSLSLVASGYTTVPLIVEGSLMVTRYAIQTPQPVFFQAGQPSGDHGLTPFDWGNVTESIDILVQSASIALEQDTIRAIERMVEIVGKQRQRSGMGPRLYLHIQLNGEASVWRTEILAARWLANDAFDQFTRLKLAGTLSITRRAFWETASEVALDLTSSSDTSPQGTVTVYNNDDASATQTNFVNIAAAQVTGSMPAPIILRLQNDEAGALAYRDFHISNTVFADPANFDPFLLGSEAEGGASATIHATDETTAYRWTPGDLTDTRLTDLAGRYYRVLLAFSSATTGVYFRPVVEVSIGGTEVEIYRGKLIYMASENLIDIGLVPLPPGGYDTLGTDIALKVNSYKPGGGSLTLDFAALMPAGEGLYRKLTVLGFTVSPGNAIVDDGVDGKAYVTDGSRHHPLVRAQAGAIMLYPNQINRLRVLYRTTTFTAGTALAVSASYRPRRHDI